VSALISAVSCFINPAAAIRITLWLFGGHDFNHVNRGVQHGDKYRLKHMATTNAILRLMVPIVVE